MKKQYTTDGRDPNAKGYVNENRMANQQETDKVVEALESFGYKNVEEYKFHLFGRLDDVYGWYLFGISKEDEEREDFLILGDCLDVLDAPYNKVLGLAEVLSFARTEGSGDNIGTAYYAMQEWGVFHSLSDGMREVIEARGGEICGESAGWDEDSAQWKLSFDVWFFTDMGHNEKESVTIPAQTGSCEEADWEFASEWSKKCEAFDMEAEISAFGGESSRADVETWVESKERALGGIYADMKEYLSGGRPPAEAKGQRDDPDGVESVWVLTICKDEQFFPCVHKNFEGAVDTAIADMKEGMENEEDYDFDAIRAELENQMYWEDELSGAVYDIAECKVFA